MILGSVFSKRGGAGSWVRSGPKEWSLEVGRGAESWGD